MSVDPLIPSVPVAAAAPGRPWRRALLWLLFLGPFFFGAYGFANWYTAQLPQVPSLVYGWERHIPFWPWTIVPYWSIDLLYAASLFLCLDRRELDTHALRLAAATAISVVGFLLFPLRFSFVRPDTDGVFGALFDSLTAFDLPYNQAPSLHISLLWLLWLRYAAHTPRGWRPLLHGWFFLIGLSVLTTWQHHMIDVVSGLAVGLFIAYALPMPPHGWPRWRSADPARARRLAACYAIGGLALLSPALYWGGWSWLLLWPAWALALLAWGYGHAGPAVFQKDAAGRQTLAAWLLLAPHRLGAWCSFRLYRPRLARLTRVDDEVWLGCHPDAATLARCAAVLDVCGELPRRALPGQPYAAVPLLDLLPPTPDELAQAVARLEQLRQQHGAVLVHCALGLSRSATVVAAWLVASGREPDTGHALRRLRAAHPAVVLHTTHLRALDASHPIIATTPIPWP
ncbi:ser/threonine protein phosphatase [Chitiniphilus shinanonensis]|uniref:Ser/threonine protein phosphatase n=1 Tax=Chitiniphilus shinanonensis TaxID=553088 RepID=A0ABQ6BTQ0_9NEIS|nr:phosphatase PAP2/dual specificity phosphatase family protein [Chitiniphilus shinanonensis]GLS04681.1 ser/threonine protein phosphatase [Chitiniphilus shinanonensis]